MKYLTKKLDDNVVTTQQVETPPVKAHVESQPSGVEYVNELKEQNINLKEKVNNLTFDSDTVNIVLK